MTAFADSRRRATGLAARLRYNATVRRIAANTGWLLGDRLVRAALGFVVGAWVARYLGPNRFGHFAYVLAVVAFFQAVANLGADGIVVRDVARDPDSAPEVLGSILRLRLVAGVVCWAAAVALTALLDPAAHETIIMTAIIGGAMVFQAGDTVDLWFQSRYQSKRTVTAKLAAYLLTNGVKIVLVMFKAPLIAFAAAFLFDFAAAALALGIAYRGLPAVRRWSFDVARARELLRQSWPFLVSGVAIIVYMRIDQIMLKQLRGDHEVGIYAAALPLSQIWQMIPVTLVMSFGPYIARQKLAGEAVYEASLRLVFPFFVALSASAAVLTFVAAPMLMPLIYGTRYVESVGILRVHVFTNVFIGLGIAQTLWIANERAGKLLLIQTVCGAVVAIAGNWLLIPLYGAYGAAWVAIGSCATSALLTNMVFAPRLFVLQLGIKSSK